ncbi:cupin domain-containing protein [Chitinibacter bivalviorum]|uniref:Cupin domain-containing protein n=1 Tax=Chitinibacter bivalviorum TaxID=2739434 RepID=A0A7H9BKY3_9NEIS|nr:cupin domain-containing protein [Chitinibacter bivalviorum]QLG88996.1 cupin domain-containing protein [Chitinibacter bivalviorum]
MKIDNLFRDTAPPLEGERFETLLSHKGLLIERIISSPRIAATEYIQSQDEWVVLLQGEATLDVAGEQIELKAGDYVFLAAQTPHTVQKVSDGAVWLAVHLHHP